MLAISGFSNIRKITQTVRKVIYRGQRDADNLDVILIALNSDHPTIEDITLLSHEYSILKNLSVPNVIKAYDMISAQDSYVLVEEDINGVSLRVYMNDYDYSLDDFFKIAKEIVSSIGQLHQKNIIHKDINPDNIIINPSTLDTRIIDFSHSTHLSQEITDVVNANKLEGTLAYIAPEQTGRMNIATDYRCDFYSLGIMFYELLTKELPFYAEDAVEFVHCHLAMLATPVHQINSDVPKMVSNIVEKLMAKSAENRYVSAQGLLADLEQCQFQWQENGAIKLFTLGESEEYQHLNISQRLYGRDSEVKELLDTYERARKGYAELFLIAGHSGIGKTALVNEVHKPMAQRRGYFISGEFDQLGRSIPYTALKEAFSEYVTRVLSDTEDNIEITKRKIQSALGNSGQVLIDVFPDLEVLIGEQSTLEEKSYLEAKNRLTYFFQRFMRSIASPERPLVIFIDDLQWVDNASLLLIETMLMDEELKNVLVIGAYRENEVSEEHRLIKMVERLSDTKLSINQVHLGPLSREDFNDFLSDTLSLNRDKVADLGEVMFQKTKGNPFFAKELLRAIYTENKLGYSQSSKRWMWDVEQINELQLADDAAEFMVNEMSKLDQDVQDVLTIASCIGHVFDLKMLAIISDYSPTQIVQLMMKSLESGLILSVGSQFKKAQSSTYDKYNLEDLHHFRFKFLHDKVQQAAYMLMDKTLQRRKNLEIGRLLMQSYIEGDDEVTIFELVDHFVVSYDLITSDYEKLQVAEHFMLAGKASLSATAYHMALKYFKSGVFLVNDDMWDTHYQLLYDLYDGEAECLALIGQFKDAEPKFDLLIEKSRNNIDKAEILRKKIVLYVSNAELEKAKQAGFVAMDLLNFKLHSRFRILQIAFSQSKVIWKLRGTDILSLYDTLPKMKDPNMTKAIQLLEPIGIATGLTDTTLALLILTKTLEETLKNGYTQRVPNTFIGLAYMMLSIGLRFPKVREVSDLSLKYLEKLPSPTNKTMCGMIRGIVIDHFLNPVREGKKYNDDAYQYGLETGDLLAASLGQTSGYFRNQYLGMSVDELLGEIRTAYKFAKQIKHKNFSPLIHVQLFIMERLLDQTDKTINDFQDDIETITNGVDVAIKGGLYGEVCRYHYLFGERELAREAGIKAQKYNLNSKLVLIYIEDKIYFAFSLVDGLRKRSKYFTYDYYRLLRVRRQLKAYAAVCPVNFQDKYLIVQAEFARLNRKFTLAAKLYEQAISVAKEQGYIHIVAVVYERLADMYLDVGIASSAKSAIIESHYFYYRWGCVVKKRYFEEKYPEWLRSTEQTTSAMTTSLGGSLASTVGMNIDLITVMKSTQAISSEIELDKLLPKIIQIILENAGAERVLFIDERKDEMLVEIEAHVEKGNEIKINDDVMLLVEKKNVAHSIIDYVLRTRDPVILDDASSNADFEHDIHIKRAAPKSILCMPILHQNRLEGLLYLENNLTFGAFTRDRVDMLQMLSSQAAISLENARMYKASIRFVPDQFLTLLGKKNIADLHLGDSIEKEMTILFSDIRDYTSISEKLSPHEATQFVNEYLSYMAPIIRNNHGFINKYIGDSIMALFPNRAEDGVNASIEMKKALKKYNKKRNAQGEDNVKIGIGVHTGAVMLCAIGEPGRVDANVISDAINAASRIESLTKLYGTITFISDSTLGQLQNPERYHYRFVDNVRVKGKQNHVVLYELLLLEGQEQIDKQEQYNKQFGKAFKLYAQGQFENAEKEFAKCFTIKPNDTVANVFIERCQEYHEQGAPQGWDGIYTLLQK